MTGADAAAELRALAKTLERLAMVSGRMELESGIVVSFGRSREAVRSKEYRDRNRDAVTVDRDKNRDVDRDGVTVETVTNHGQRHGSQGERGGIAPSGSPTPPPDFSGSVGNDSDPEETPALVLASDQGSESRRARRKKPAAVDVPAALTEDYEPDPEQVAALAAKYQVTEARIRAEVPEFRWYWRKSTGAGKRKTRRGWGQAFSNRIQQLARNETLYAEPRRNGPRQQVPFQRAPEAHTGETVDEFEARKRAILAGRA